MELLQAEAISKIGWKEQHWIMLQKRIVEMHVLVIVV